jgi:gamma-glutamyltranspeptidase/glutathione hydrolase
MVSLSFTHGPSFGSFVTVPRMGLILNAGMSRFDPGSGLPNSVAPGKRPIINMAPVLALRDGVPFLTMGASGGTRIPSSLFQVLARRLVLEEDIEWSVSAGRLHSEGNDWVRIEEEFGELAPQYLKEVGYTLSKKGTAAAVVRAIEVDEDGKLTAVMDPRMGNVKEKGY